MRIPPSRAGLEAAPLPLWAWAVATTLLAAHGVLAWMLRASMLRTGNDDATYLLLARSLRHFTYRDIHILGTPIHSQYPPAYPALLALTGGGLGLDLTWPSLTSVVLSIIGVALIFDLARRVMPLRFALALLALLALNSPLMTFAGSVRSEIPYATFSIAAIWAMSVFPSSRKAVLGGAVLALLAGLTRSIGGTLLGAVVLYWLSEKEYRRAIGFGVASALTLGAWTVWNFLAPVQFARRSYAMMATAAQLADVQQPWMLLVHRLERFGKVYALSFPANLSVPSIEGQWIDNVFWLGLILLLVGLGCYASWRKAPLVGLYTACYIAFLALWPTKLSRFVVPIVPFLLLLLVWGAWTVAERFQHRAIQVAFGLIVILLSWGALSTVQTRLLARRNCDPRAVVVSASCPSIDEQSFYHLMDYVRAELPDSAVVVTTKEATFGIFTGHKVMHPDMAVAHFGKDFLPALHTAGVSYLVINPLVPSPLPTELLPRCRSLRLVQDFPPRTALLQLRPDSTGEADPRACAVIARLAADTTWLGDRS